MTTAIVAFFADSEYKTGIYYNSDGYIRHVGKIVSKFLENHPVHDSVGALIGDYIIDKETKSYELARNKSASDIPNWLNFAYFIYYDSVAKKVERVEVKDNYGERSFIGTVAEYIKWVENLSRENDE